MNKHSIDSSDEDTGSLDVLENGHIADFEYSQSPSSRNKSSQKSTIETGLRRTYKSISFSSVLSKNWQRRVLQLLSIFSIFIIFWSDETTKDQIDKDFNIRKEEELTDVKTVQSISGWHLNLMNPQDGKSVNGQNSGKIIRPKMAEANALSNNEPQDQHSDSFQSFSLTDDEIKKRIDETYRKYQATNFWPKISKPVLFAWAYLALVVMNAIWTMGTNLFRQLTLY
ncbi:predicted protein [Chaetoceros tenuissimus]|uniref:Uncharacterized protein n=1 Tax=Chaetoceros tenuissimus TaxID=426638 RepID=A0AAD3DBK1_9STRA|nr:predicted protein [Chaetoceros tenuissimus]